MLQPHRFFWDATFQSDRGGPPAPAPDLYNPSRVLIVGLVALLDLAVCVCVGVCVPFHSWWLLVKYLKWYEMFSESHEGGVWRKITAVWLLSLCASVGLHCVMLPLCVYASSPGSVPLKSPQYIYRKEVRRIKKVTTCLRHDVLYLCHFITLY